MSPEPQSISFDRERWQRALADISEALGNEGPELQLCLIGSAACLFGGMDGRTSRDLDIWKPASDYDLLELKSAVESAGLLFDPKGHLDPELPYIQIVEPGLTQIGDFKPVRIDRLGRLILLRPPIENLIAAKLIRSEPKDIEDIQFLYKLHQPDPNRIKQIIESFPASARERAGENIIYLEILK
ncbi:MAG: DUF6036 family nucleotidyltransferase [Akkermansiaceae bacterium]